MHPRRQKLGTHGAPNESALVTAILRALKLRDIEAWRVNSGLTVLKAQGGHARRVVKGAPAGSPDIMLVLPVMATSLSLGAGGMSLESQEWAALCGLEVKTTTGRQSDSQRTWQAKMMRRGVRYAVVRSIGEALATVESWRTGRAVLVREGKAVSQ